MLRKQGNFHCESKQVPKELVARDEDRIEDIKAQQDTGHAREAVVTSGARVNVGQDALYEGATVFAGHGGKCGANGEADS
jgi:hypothetical protein